MSKLKIALAAAKSRQSGSIVEAKGKPKARNMTAAEKSEAKKAKDFAAAQVAAGKQLPPATAETASTNGDTITADEILKRSGGAFDFQSELLQKINNPDNANSDSYQEEVDFIASILSGEDPSRKDELDFVSQMLNTKEYAHAADVLKFKQDLPSNEQPAATADTTANVDVTPNPEPAPEPVKGDTKDDEKAAAPEATTTPVTPVVPAPKQETVTSIVRLPDPANAAEGQKDTMTYQNLLAKIEKNKDGNKFTIDLRNTDLVQSELIVDGKIFTQIGQVYEYVLFDAHQELLDGVATIDIMLTKDNNIVPFIMAKIPSTINVSVHCTDNDTIGGCTFARETEGRIVIHGESVLTAVVGKIPPTKSTLVMKNTLVSDLSCITFARSGIKIENNNGLTSIDSITHSTTHLTLINLLKLTNVDTEIGITELEISLCGNLVELNIPNKIRNLQSVIVSDCAELTKLVVSEGSAADITISGCKKLGMVHIDASSTGNVNLAGNAIATVNTSTLPKFADIDLSNNNLPANAVAYLSHNYKNVTVGEQQGEVDAHSDNYTLAHKLGVNPEHVKNGHYSGNINANYEGAMADLMTLIADHYLTSVQDSITITDSTFTGTKVDGKAFNVKNCVYTFNALTTSVLLPVGKVSTKFVSCPELAVIGGSVHNTLIIENCPQVKCYSLTGVKSVQKLITQTSFYKFSPTNTVTSFPVVDDVAVSDTTNDNYIVSVRSGMSSAMHDKIANINGKPFAETTHANVYNTHKAYSAAQP